MIIHLTKSSMNFKIEYQVPSLKLKEKILFIILSGLGKPISPIKLFYLNCNTFQNYPT